MLRIVTIGVLAAAAATAAGPQEQAATVLSRVTVIDVERGVAVPDQDVVLEGAYIRAVRLHGSAPIARGARVIDARGRYVIPGLWEMHAHLTEAPWRTTALAQNSSDALSRTYFSALLLAAGVTGVRDMGGDLLRLRRWVSDAVANPGGPPMPRLIATGAKLERRPVLPGAPFPLRSAEDVRTSVRMLREAGAEHVKLGESQPLWFLQAAAAACQREGIRCTGHVPANMDMVSAAVAGWHFEHLFLVADNVSSVPFDTVALFRRQATAPTLWERVLWKTGLKPRISANAADTAELTHSPSRAATVFGQLARAKTWVTPTLTLHDMIVLATPKHPAARDTALMTERG